MITEQVQEQYMEGKEYLQILARLRITITKKEDPSISIVTSIDIWLRNAKKRKRGIQENISNMKE